MFPLARSPLLLFASLLLLCGQLITSRADGLTVVLDNNLIYETKLKGPEPNFGSPSTAMGDTTKDEASAMEKILEIMLEKGSGNGLEVWDAGEESKSSQEPEIVPLALHESQLRTRSNSSPQPESDLPNRPTRKASPPSPFPVIQAPLDALFDFALGAVRFELITNHSTEEPVPDFKQQFKVRVGPFKVHGYLEASQGRAGDISSLYRDGPVSLTQESGGVIVLNAAAGLKTLKVRYSHYSARAGPVHVSGSLEAEASPAVLRVQLELRQPCQLHLRSLNVAALGPLQLRVSGLGVLKELLPLIRQWMNKRMRNEIEHAVVTNLSSFVRQRLQQFSC